jgi:competence protein ComEA
MRRMMMMVLVGFAFLALAGQTQVYAAGKVNINTASKRKLERLPGIGSDLAVRIIEHRKEFGPFDNLAELKDVPGIGERRIEVLKEEVTFGILAEKRL